MKDGDKL